MKCKNCQIEFSSNRIGKKFCTLDCYSRSAYNPAKTPTNRQRMSQFRKGVPLSPETRKKQSETLSKILATPEMKEKWSRTAKNTYEGLTPEQKTERAKNISIGRSKKPKTKGKLKKDLWKLFSKYIRNRDGGICFICSRKAEGSGYHAGHFIPKSVGGLELYFHEDNVHGCCYNCNINLGGNLYEYGMKLGKEMCDKLYDLKYKNTVWDEIQYLEMIKKYSELLKNG